MKRLQTLYEYFSSYSKDVIDKVINNLNEEEKDLIKLRYGDDLSNPVTSSEWNREKTNKFYGTLIPKLKRLLIKELNNSDDIKEEKSKDDILSDENNIKLINKEEPFIYPNLLLEEIKKGKSNYEICEKFNINSDILYKVLLNLKNNGIAFSRKYYSDGTIKYKPISNISEYKKINSINFDKTIISDSKENDMKFLVISDLHLGNSDERLDLIDRAFNYCAKNGINNILCGGDFIDGAFTKGKQNISDIYKQIEYFIKNYPYDKNILTYGVGGDHDISALNSAYLNLIEIFNNLRHDIIIGGFNNAKINIKNDTIQLYHFINNGEIIPSNAPIILHGHSHKYSTRIINDVLNITIPTLSNILQEMPSALELNLSFYKGYIKDVSIKQIYFGTNDFILNEQNYDLLKNREVSYVPIKNIELYKSDIELSSKTLKLEKQPLSQIEKFNIRLQKK